MKDIISNLSNELNIPEKLIEEAYQGYWLFIRKHIIEMPFKENLTQEEFSKLRTNFNIPNLGKLSCTYKRYLGVKKHINEYLKKDEHKRNKTNE